MGAIAQRPFSRAETGPYVHYKRGKPVQHKITPATRAMIVRIFRRRRFATPEYVARLLGLNYSATISRFKALRVMKVLRLCGPQRRHAGLRMTGHLYSELHTEGYTILEEEGYDTVRPDEHLDDDADDDQFPHELAIDLTMLSLEIGIEEDGDLELTYRDDLPKHYELQPVVIKDKKKGDITKRRFMKCDEIPVTLSSKSRGTKRHIAGLEVETGANDLSNKDADRASVVRKFKNMIWLMESGELERTHGFGKQFYWAFIFRTERRMRSAMERLVELTAHNPELRKHFIFKKHPIFGKSKEKPRASGHILTEPWERASLPALYLNGGGQSAQRQASADQGVDSRKGED